MDARGLEMAFAVRDAGDISLLHPFWVHGRKHTPTNVTTALHRPEQGWMGRKYHYTCPSACMKNACSATCSHCACFQCANHYVSDQLCLLLQGEIGGLQERRWEIWAPQGAEEEAEHMVR